MTGNASTEDDGNPSEPAGESGAEPADAEARELPAARSDEEAQADQTADEAAEVEPDAEASPSDRRGRFPGWDVLSGMSGIVAAVLAVAALVVALFAWLLPRSAAPADADLEIVKTEVSRLQEVGLDPETRTADDAGLSNVQDLAVDVHLFNRGGSPVLIEAIAARVLFNRHLELCPPTGGYLGADMLYDIRIFAEPDNLEPVVVQRAFQVAPNSYDRLAVTVGPYGSDVPYVYAVQLDAVLAGSGDHVDLGTFTLVNPTSSLGVYRAQVYSGDPRQAECIRHNAENLRAATRFGGTVAPEILLLADRFARAVERLDAGQPLVAPGDDSASPASRSLPQCERADHPTTVSFEQHADVTGDGRIDVVLTQACGTDRASHEVTFFDGTAPETPQLLLGSADGIDGRGLASAGIAVSDGVVMVYGTAYRASDNDSNASLSTVDSFSWNGTRMVRTGERSCSEWASEGTAVPCTP